MTQRNTGGPAFPQPTDSTLLWQGMTLRDYFAAKAMQGLLAGWTDASLPRTDILAPAAYQYADSMLKAREQ